MPRGPKERAPRADVIGNAVKVMRIAHTGEEIETLASPKPTDGCMANAEGPGNVHQGLACLPSRQRLPPLMRIERRRPAHVNALGLRALATLARAGADQLPLELGEPAQHRQH